MLNDTATPANVTPAPAQPRPRAAAPFRHMQPVKSIDTCDWCGEAQGFLTDGLHECGACATFRLQTVLARQQLEAAVAPIVGMWVADWRRQGLPLNELGALVEMAVGADRIDEEQYRLKRLRLLGMAYREATLAPEPDPMRVMVDPAELPMIARAFYDPTAPERFRDRPAFFTAGDKKQVDIAPGIDTMVLTLEGGVRAVIYLTRTYGDRGFRCPEGLWPIVAAQLKYLPKEAMSSTPDVGSNPSAA